MRSLDDVQLVKSQDFFVTKERVILGGLDRSAIVNFVTKERFMLAAEVNNANRFFVLHSWRNFIGKSTLKRGPGHFFLWYA